MGRGTATERDEAEPPTALLEREADLDRIVAALDAAVDGDGGVLLVRGVPGIGKTSLLDVLARHAAAREARTLRATADPLERALPFGILRTLFEETLASASPAERDRLLAGSARHVAGVVDPRAEDHAPEEVLGAAHGLRWLCVRLAEERPLVLVVDDVQWADVGSAVALGYLARRLAGRRILLALGMRAAPEPDEDPAVTALSELPGATVVIPVALSPDGTATLTEAALGTPPAPSLVAACHRATGGNPFALVALLREARARGLAPDDGSAGWLDALAPDEIVRAAIGRSRRAGPLGEPVATAVAILQPHATIGRVAALVGATVEDVAPVADQLLRSDLLGSTAPCAFRHPILRSAVERSVPPATLASRHGRAAELLLAEGAAPLDVAVHLLRSAATGSPEVVATLRAAAREATRRAAPTTAAACLARALEEPPASHERPTLLRELGVVELHLGRRTAANRLRAAMATDPDPEGRTHAALALADALGQAGDLDGGHAVARDAAAARGDATDPLSLRAHAAAITSSIPVGRHHVVSAPEPAAGGGPESSALLAALAFRDLVAGAPAERVRRRVRAALASGPADRAQIGVGGEAAALGLLWLDDLDEAERLFTHALDDAEDAGALGTVAYVATLRAYGRHRAGDLAGAEQDLARAEAAVEGDGRFAFWRLLSAMTAIQLRIDRGVAAEGVALGEAVLALTPPPMRDVAAVLFLRAVHGRALLAAGRAADACTTLEAVGAGFRAVRVEAPAPVAWRADLTVARHLAGRAEAATPAAEELEVARRGGFPRTAGAALRALGVVAAHGAPERGEPLLREAIATLERCPAPLELAAALHDLGALLRRDNRRAEARAPLRQALDIAHRAGAHGLETRIAGELRMTGARPRSAVLSGLDALTPAELRVCRLASGGRTNEEIARELVVSRKTVESHLGHAYRKLDITGRDGLPAALAPTDG